MLYLRKIKTEAWQNKSPRDSDSISDLGTTNHELSVWEVSDKDNLMEIALAFAMTQSKISDFVAVLLDPDEIENKVGLKLTILDNPGQTLYKAKTFYHKDFILENVDHMIKLAEYIHDIIGSENADLVKPFNVIDLKNELERIVKNGEIKIEDFEDDKNKGGQWGKAVKAINKNIKE